MMPRTASASTLAERWASLLARAGETTGDASDDALILDHLLACLTPYLARVLAGMRDAPGGQSAIAALRPGGDHREWQGTTQRALAQTLRDGDDVRLAEAMIALTALGLVRRQDATRHVLTIVGVRLLLACDAAAL